MSKSAPVKELRPDSSLLRQTAAAQANRSDKREPPSARAMSAIESRSVAPIDPSSRLFAQTIATMRKMGQRRQPPSVREASKPPEEAPLVPRIDPNSRLFAHTTATIRKRNERKEHKPEPHNWSKFFTQSYAAPKLDTADTYSRLLVPGTQKTMPGPYQQAKSVSSEPVPSRERETRGEAPVVSRIDPSSRLFTFTKVAAARRLNNKKEYKPQPSNWSRYFAKSYATPKVDTADTFSRLLVPATSKTMPGPVYPKSVSSEPVPSKASLNRSVTASTAPSSRASMLLQEDDDEGNEPPEESECPDGDTTFADEQAPMTDNAVEDSKNEEENPYREMSYASGDHNLDADLGNYARSVAAPDTVSQHSSQFALPDSDDEDEDGELYLALSNGEGIEKLREKKLQYLT